MFKFRKQGKDYIVSRCGNSWRFSNLHDALEFMFRERENCAG